MAIVALLVSFITVTQKPGTANAAPISPACQPAGYLFQYPSNNVGPTETYSVDLITGKVNPFQTLNGTFTVNAVGYNVLDNYMYGWDNNAATPKLVRVEQNGGQLSVYDGPEVVVNATNGPLTPGIIPAGDVDNNGQYWFSNSTHWFRVDLTANPPVYDSTTSTSTLYGAVPPKLAASDADVSFPLDYAYVPPTILNGNRSGLYTVVLDKTGGPPHTSQLYRFNITDPLNPVWEHIGPLPEINATDGVVGALYADAYGALYAGSNSGPVWRIIVGPSNTPSAVQVGAGKVATDNDGVRCANAYPPVDFGDAPSSYSTTLDEIGPLHVIASFNLANSAAPLMLGNYIDIESNGFPSPAATGDDDNHTSGPYLNDEDGVQHIVAPPTPVDLKIPVTVTNTDASNPATLVGWIDSDNDGDFFNNDAQKVTQVIPAGSGTQTYELTFPGQDFSAGTTTFARFRVFQGTGQDNSELQPAGFDSSFRIGEVEDHRVQVGSYDVKKTSTPATGSSVIPDQEVIYNVEITNTGSTPLDNLTINDNLSDVLDDATLVGSPAVNPGSAGSANVTGTTLQFDGDIPAGQSVAVSYTVKVKPAAQLANRTMQNFVIAAHSNCHPTTFGQTVIADSPDCTTQHTIDAELADTGQNPSIWIAISTSLVVISVALFKYHSRMSGFLAKMK